MITKQRPTRLWRGKSRLAKKFIGRSRSILEWAIGISPGDWIGTCEGCNRQVKEIEYIWENEGDFRRMKKNKTWVLFEVEFFDSKGGSHYCPGGGCAFPKQSSEMIEDYYKGWIRAFEDPNTPICDDDKFRQKINLMKEAFANGKSIVDGNGEFLPEFDR